MSEAEVTQAVAIRYSSFQMDMVDCCLQLNFTIDLRGVVLFFRRKNAILCGR